MEILTFALLTWTTLGLGTALSLLLAAATMRRYGPVVAAAFQDAHDDYAPPLARHRTRRKICRALIRAWLVARALGTSPLAALRLLLGAPGRLLGSATRFVYVVVLAASRGVAAAGRSVVSAFIVVASAVFHPVRALAALDLPFRARRRRRMRLKPTAAQTRDVGVTFAVAQPTTTSVPLRVRPPEERAARWHDLDVAGAVEPAVHEVEAGNVLAHEPAPAPTAGAATAAAVERVEPAAEVPATPADQRAAVDSGRRVELEAEATMMLAAAHAHLRSVEPPQPQSSMLPLYRRTFRRHRRLFVLPVVLAVLLAAWVTFGEPHTYRSTATLWADPVGGPPPETIGAPTAAAQEQSMLAELLTTQRFRDDVAHRGPLADYLERHGPQGWGPTALLARLRGAGSLGDRIAAELGSARVRSVALGPHVVRVELDALAPGLAAGTLSALVAEFREERMVLRGEALAAYREDVGTATEALAEARSERFAFVRRHPNAAATDPRLVMLTTAERNAAARLRDANQAFRQASGSLASGAAQRSLRVIDAPNLPTSPSAGMKRAAFGLAGGLFAGIVVSLLGIVLVARTRSAGGPPEAPGSGGGDGVVAEAPFGRTGSP